MSTSVRSVATSRTRSLTRAIKRRSGSAANVHVFFATMEVSVAEQ